MDATAILFWVTGLLIGIGASWFFLRQSAQAASAALQATVQKLNEELRTETDRRSRAEAQAEGAHRLEAKLTEMEGFRTALQTEKQTLAETLAKTETRLAEEQLRHTEKLATLETAKEDLALRFENLANKLLEEKSAKFTTLNKTNMDTLLVPLGERLKELQTKVEEKFTTEGKERAALSKQVEMLHELNKQISVEAANLATALKGNVKTQGNWGEMLLEKILERSGLRKGDEYDTQVHKKDGDEGYFLDAVINFPGERYLIIDSKVSLIAYERHCSAASPEEQQAALKELHRSVRAHVDGLAGKAYQNLMEGRSPDLVMMFIPIEPVFLLAAQYDPELFVYAFDRKIMIVGPSTLLATLRTVATIWQYERQNRNVQKMVLEAGKLYEEFVVFADEMGDIEVAIRGVQSAYDQAHKRLATGKGNLVRKAQNLKVLGAKSPKGKELPGDLVQLALEGDGEEGAGEPV